eukprot:1653940-Pleurochrysis_carterae.AAC.8
MCAFRRAHRHAHGRAHISRARVRHRPAIRPDGERAAAHAGRTPRAWASVAPPGGMTGHRTGL